MHIIKELYKEIVRTNGFTYAPQREVPKRGYMVSLKGFESIERTSSDILMKYAIQEYIKDKIIYVLSNDAFFGGWLDGQYLYLDVSMWYDTKAEAIEAATKNNQLAYYDLDKRESIKMPRNVEANGSNN